MKRISLAVLSIALFPVLATAQEQGWAAKFFPAGLTHNFGTIAYGSLQTHKFTITNIYNVPFQVTEARVSCGCVDAKRPAIIIPPRGTAELEVVMNTRRIPKGTFTASPYRRASAPYVRIGSRAIRAHHRPASNPARGPATSPRVPQP